MECTGLAYLLDFEVVGVAVDRQLMGGGQWLHDGGEQGRYGQHC